MEHIVNKFFAAMAQRNLDDILALIADETDWYIPGNEAIAPWLGHRSTKAAIADFYRMLWENTEAVEGHIDHSFTQGNVNLTAGRFTTRMLQTGKLYESIFFTSMTIENDLIVKYRLLEEGYGLVKALQP
ncbi:nuclear transport factor 2 family protein [Chitinophaga sp. Mgbs1]|uniref:Nuclear transport factor 2 family protein n=1 Tax=Chitinophaga solisilvae TaxID=1233460 RepID=A0A9Q5D9P0_9BACT|nr:nuclear transport factor 2 family protein [Chitinophaga solisilvae]